MSKTIVAAVLAVAVLACAPVSSAAVNITTIYFNSPGSDGGSSSSLNSEWIRLKNTGSQAKPLNGWTIRDIANHVYRFGAFTLRPGKTVTVHTGSGANGASHRYWGQDWYIWNNDGDTARLRNGAGSLIDRCSYSGAGSYVAC